MRTVHSVIALQKLMLAEKSSVGFVPTMGALHEGHLSLIRRARRENTVVVVSIFVNPTQFGPQEDLARYPRPFARDARLCREAGVDVLFAPRPEDMYPAGYDTFVHVGRMADVLCGASRPGHFRGVATVVAKLFSIVRPTRAYFGLKDYQQCKIIQRMVRDLNMPVKVVPCPTVREPSGLALSSRNQYLSPSEKSASAGLSRALHSAGEMIQCGQRRTATGIRAMIAAQVRRIPGAVIDYIAVVDPETLAPQATAVLPVAILLAVRVGRTRLIDNIVLQKR